MGEQDWVKKLSLEEINQMLEELQEEADLRFSSRRAEAWNKVKTAIREFLEIGPIEINHHENSVYMDKSHSLDMDTVGLIEIDLENW